MRVIVTYWMCFFLLMAPVSLQGLAGIVNPDLPRQRLSSTALLLNFKYAKLGIKRVSN